MSAGSASPTLADRDVGDDPGLRPNHPDQAGFETPITVYNPGGMVKTILHHHDARCTIDLIGNATFTHQIEVHEAALHDAQVTDADVTVTETGEQAAY